MAVTITIDKPVYLRELRAEFVAAGYRTFSYRDNEFITVEDATDATAVRAIYDAHSTAAYDAIAAQVVTARSAILTTAQTTVGLKLTDLTAAQIKALVACMLYAAGGVDVKTMTVRSLSEWMR